MTFVAEPLTVLAVMISRSQVDVALPWLIGGTIVCAVGWVLIAADMRRHRESHERDAKKPVAEPPRPAR